jgi:hypothetical protein
VFVYPAEMDWPRIVDRLRVSGAPTVYVLRNAFLDASFNGVQRKVLPIASRSIQSMIQTQGLGDLYQIYSLCVRDGNEFKLAYIRRISPSRRPRISTRCTWGSTSSTATRWRARAISGAPSRPALERANTMR